jgi:hypothetical protein
MPATEITVLTKLGGPLTKKISLAFDGTIESDGSACVMSHGRARRAHVENATALANLITTLDQTQAIALGALRPDLPDPVEVVTKRKLNGQPRTIARTADHIAYRCESPAWALLDFDAKGMPANVAAALQAHRSYWRALVMVLPVLETAGRLQRRSTSAGLSRADTGQKLPGSSNLHVYVQVKDGTDIERFLQVLHARCWLAGLGWLMVGAGGQLLERSIVDRMVGAPERLVFEGAPILVAPLQQDPKGRLPVARDGEALDTLSACPPLTVAETSRLRELKTKHAHRLAPESAKARASFVATQAKRLAERTGGQTAARTINRQCDGVLLPDLVLPFDDQDLAGSTVAEVLADPLKFEGATLADPLEGIEYGACKAKIMCRADGMPWIHSFAHGRTVYELKLDATAIRKAIAGASAETTVKTFVRLAATADLSDDEIEELRNQTAEQSGTGRRTISNMLKAAQQKRAAEQAQEERKRRLAERSDPRPQIPAPETEAPWLPQMATLNEVLGTATPPPERNGNSGLTNTHKMPVPATHAFISTEANNEQENL